MYTLTIDDHGADTITLHDTPAAARATLNTYLELADYDCRPAQLSTGHTAYELLAPHEDDPRIVGVATIEPYTELSPPSTPPDPQHSRAKRRLRAAPPKAKLDDSPVAMAAHPRRVQSPHRMQIPDRAHRVGAHRPQRHRQGLALAGPRRPSMGRPRRCHARVPARYQASPMAYPLRLDRHPRRRRTTQRLSVPGQDRPQRTCARKRFGRRLPVIHVPSHHS